MNTPQTEDEKRRIIADIIRDRLPWHSREPGADKWWSMEAGNLPDLPRFIGGNPTKPTMEIRIAPAPPEKWFPDKGQWYEERMSTGWHQEQAGYTKNVYEELGREFGREYRPCDPPPEPEWVELGPEDVPPGSVFRLTFRQTGWHNPVQISEGMVHWSDDGYSTWTHLKGHWQILRPGGTWEPCRKAKV